MDCNIEKSRSIDLAYSQIWENKMRVLVKGAAWAAPIVTCLAA